MNDEYTPPQSALEAIQDMIDDGDADPIGTARMNHPHLFDIVDYPVPGPIDEEPIYNPLEDYRIHFITNYAIKRAGEAYLIDLVIEAKTAWEEIIKP